MPIEFNDFQLKEALKETRILNNFQVGERFFHSYGIIFHLTMLYIQDTEKKILFLGY